MTKPIYIDNETTLRLRIFIAAWHSGKTHGNIGPTASKAINQYIDSIEDECERLARESLNKNDKHKITI